MGREVDGGLISSGFGLEVDSSVFYKCVGSRTATHACALALGRLLYNASPTPRIAEALGGPPPGALEASLLVPDLAFD